jgi:hypothetical protein
MMGRITHGMEPGPDCEDNYVDPDIYHLLNRREASWSLRAVFSLKEGKLLSHTKLL